MTILKTASDAAIHIQKLKDEGFAIQFVPTMGALHQGHISLLQKAQSPTSKVIASIFVNPTQFNSAYDFEKYPQTIEKDVYQLEKNGTAILFLPTVTEMYPDGTERKKNYTLGYLETILEGTFRPGHFQGVCQVVEKLLSIVKPDTLIIGQKDYQQCMVLKMMVQNLNLPVHIEIGETLREADGLAMSSRNMRLAPEERKKAPAIYQTLLSMKAQMEPGDIGQIKSSGFNKLINEGFKPDYTEIADAATLLPVTNWDGKRKLVILAAAYLKEVRLIDNLLL